jgi:hypothetical protein
MESGFRLRRDGEINRLYGGRLAGDYAETTFGPHQKAGCATSNPSRFARLLIRAMAPTHLLCER